MQKRGQAAVEFLLTYGWAVLVVLTILGALAYMEVLSPGWLMPSNCVIGPGFGCKEYKASPRSMQLTIFNGLVTTLQPVSFHFTGDVAKCEKIAILANPVDCAPSTGASWPGEPSCVILPGGSELWEIYDNLDNCTAGECAIRVYALPHQSGGHQVKMIFNGCHESDGGPLRGMQEIDVKVEYRLEDESVVHSAEGKARLKVESK